MTRILLDTHAFLWFVSNDEHLSAHARSCIEDGANEIHLSVASVWEMAIKTGLGRLQLERPLNEIIEIETRTNRLQILPVDANHALAVADLPHHHRDPFDRLIAAQSRLMQLELVSIDQIFDRYGVRRIW